MSWVSARRGVAIRRRVGLINMELGVEGVPSVVMASSRGLGFACATALARSGARVFMNGRDEKSLVAAAGIVGAEGYMVGDMSDRATVEALAERALAEFGTVGILVVNCGGPPTGRFFDMANMDWVSAFEGTLMSAVCAIQAFVPIMEAGGWGRIVIIGASGYREPQPKLAVSDAMRASVAVVAKVMSDEMAPKNITVNTIAPGMFETDRMRQILGPDFVQRTSAAVPMRRLGNPEEVGDLCAFLCSKLAGYITGQTIVIDGGVQRGV